METLRGYTLKNRKGLSQWGSLLEEWLLTMERYSRIMGGEDAAYWYNERANIGMLAGAAWRCGRIALEEFQQKKGYRNRSKNNGRCDLWISTEINEAIIEAKFKWLSLRSTKTKEIVERIIKKATQDAKKTRGNEGDLQAIAVGFFPVYVPKKWGDKVDQLIEESIEKFCLVDYHALAWCFPKENRKKISTKGYLYPGIIMVIKNIEY